MSGGELYPRRILSPMGYRWIAGLSAALMLFAAPPAVPQTASTVEILDPTTGEIGGRRALAIHPMRYEGRKAVEALSAEGCVARLVSRESYEIFTRPCGAWFLVPPDGYDYWVEREWEISPHTGKLFFADEPFTKRGMLAAMPLAPAGRVCGPVGVGSEARLELRLIHADPPVVDGLLRGAITRRVPVGEFSAGVLMPMGKTLAALWDQAGSRYVMLSRPFDVSGEETIVAPLEEPPAERAHLLAQVVRHRVVSEVAKDTLEVELHRVGAPKKPDLRIGQGDSVYAVWYDLEPGPVEIRARTAGAAMEPLALEIEPGTIARALGTMEQAPPGPSLGVDLDLPAPLWDQETKLLVRRLPEGELVAQRFVAEGEWSLRFDDLPTGVVEVTLETRLGPVSSRVELEEGDEGFVRLVLDPIVLSGQVLIDGQGQRSELTFTSIKRHAVSISSDTEGRYELVTLEPVRSVSIVLAKTEHEPYVEFFPQRIDASAERDFEIPSNRFEVAVFDAVSGAGIEGVRVVGRNRYQLEEGEGEANEMAVMQRSETDPKGIAHLPPLRPGHLEITASSEDYRPMDQPLVVEILPEVRKGRFEVRLEPFGERAEVRVLLPSGQPAVGARFALADTGGKLIFETTSDAEGLVFPPLTGLGLTALARHPMSAFRISSWPPNSEGDITWQLGPRAAPLRVRVVDAAGVPMTHARVGLRLDGVLLTGRPLYWLTGERPMADATGHWSATNLPNGPLAIVAWGSGSHTPGAPTLAAMAEPLVPPWPELVEIMAVTD